MPTTYRATLTEVGAALVADAIASGTTLTWAKMALGDGNGSAVTVDPSRTSLVNEQYRAPLNDLGRDSANPNTIVGTLVVPPETGGWTIREFGIYDNAATPRLVAYGETPEIEKPASSAGTGINLRLRFKLVVSAEANITLAPDSNEAYATIEYVKDNAVKSLSVSGRTITYTMGDGDTHTINTQDTVFTHPSYTAQIGKPTTNQTPGFGDAVTVSQVKSDDTGHVTAMDDKTITIPATEATRSKAGLMSATDKKALDAVPDTYMPNRVADLGSDYVMNINDFSRVGYYTCISLASSPSGNAPDNNLGDYHIWCLSNNTNYRVFMLTSPRLSDRVYFGHFWGAVWQGWTASSRLSDISAFIPASVGSETNPVYSNSNGVITPCNNTNLASALINALSTATSTPQDNDYFVSQHVGGDTTNTNYFRRKFSTLYTYLKNKLDSVFLSLSGGTITGNIILHYAHLMNNVDTAETQIHGGSGWYKGATLALHGYDKTENQGDFVLYASNGTDIKALKGKASGNLQWDAKDLEIVVAKTMNNTAGYIKYKSGLTTCWGDYSTTAAGKTVTFPVAFNATPRIACFVCPVSTSTASNTTAVPLERSATGFKGYLYNAAGLTIGNCSYIAIGYSA